MKATITRESAITRSARAMQIEGMFDVPPAGSSKLSWEVDLPIEERDWNIGLIVGPSGCGKSTVARSLWPKQYLTGFKWPKSGSVLDGFPEDMGAKDVVMALSAVGFSSPPAWLRPFGVLSTGEQFRATVARALAENADLTVIDEFTSVVDRLVAKIGSAAVSKTVRKRGSKLIAVTCHDDVEEWLNPDWVFCPAELRFAWRKLRRRPPIKIEIRRIHREAWRIFAPHHYLTAELANSAACFGGFIDGRLVAFHSYLPFVGRLAHGKAYRGHRSVVLPDFQGVGIGHALITECARIVGGWGYRVFRNTGHPAEIAAASRDANWEMIRVPSRTARESRTSNHPGLGRAHATHRLTASFEFIGKVLPKAEALPFRESVA